MPSPLYLIDASIYIFRHYFAMPDNWYSREGYSTQAIYGYLNFLLTLIEKESPEYIAAAFDESLSHCFRNKIYPDYKANRALPDEALAFQLNACAEVTGILGITGFASNTHEADDIIGTLANRGRQRHGRQIIVVSRDKDLMQLVGPEDLIWDYGYAEPQDRMAVMVRMGVWPEQLADYLALVGDSVDNIPGVPGVGAKTAAALLKHFGSLHALLQADELIAEAPVRGAKNLPAKIGAYREQILMARELTKIAENAPMDNVEINPEANVELKRQPVALNALTDFCQRMGLGERLLAKADRLVDGMGSTL
ncbi:MAG: 5'-3' exonuclease H3TH domain-containing protein [Porticoccus sp.]|nr:5'-3' exonuclease H3TH domain-containing protein [Porticoccus sp.]